MSTVLYEHVKQQTEAVKQVAVDHLKHIESSIQSLKAQPIVQEAWQSTRNAMQPYCNTLNGLLVDATREWNLALKYFFDLEMKVYSQMGKVLNEGVEYCLNYWYDGPVTSSNNSTVPPGYAVIPPKTILAAYYFNLDVTENVKKLMDNGTFRLPLNADINAVFTNPLKGQYKPLIVVWTTETGCVQSRAFMQEVVAQQREIILWN